MKRKRASTKNPGRRLRQSIQIQPADCEHDDQPHKETQHTGTTSSQTKTKKEKTGTPLQLLPFPSEIRHQIYEYVLYVPNTASRDSFDKRPWWVKSAPTPKNFNLSILLASKQTYIEAHHIFYRINELIFKDTSALFQFLCHIGYVRRQQIVSISFQKFERNAKLAFRLLKSCQRLKCLRFLLPDDKPPGYAALREVRGIEDVEIFCYPLPIWDIHWFKGSALKQALQQAMSRPRLKRYEPNDEKKLDLFKKHREILPKTDAEELAIKMLWR